MTTEVGLRERKRQRTRRRLEEAAIGLALRDGLDKVTIDAISARADVSPRTFFNYFDSKEDAILGVRPPDISDETLAAHRVRYAESDLVESLIGLLIAVLGPSIDEPAFRGTRMEVVRQHPELLERMMTRMARMTEQLTAAAERSARRSTAACRRRAVSDGVAETLLMTCAGRYSRGDQTMDDDRRATFPGRTGTTGGRARSRDNRETDMTEHPTPAGAVRRCSGRRSSGRRQRAAHPAGLRRPDGHDAAGVARPDDLQHGAADHRRRTRRRQPHAVGDHRLHPRLHHHVAGLRQSSAT